FHSTFYLIPSFTMFVLFSSASIPTTLSLHDALPIYPDRLVPPRPHPLRSSLRQDGRHQPPTSLLRQHHQTPPQPHRRPTPQPRPPHHRHHPHPLLPHHPRLHPTTTSRRQNPQRNPTLPQALHHPTALPPPHHHTPKPHLTHIEASRRRSPASRAGTGLPGAARPGRSSAGAPPGC